MAHEDHDALYEQLASRGVSRRDFLKYCGSIAALLGLSEAYVPQIASAVALGAELKPALWFNGGSCSGCTESTAQNFDPDVATIVLDILSVNYFETVMMAQGEDAEKAAEDTIKAGGYVLVYEGTVMQGEDGNTLRIAGRTGLEILEEAAASAEAVIAVGSCAVDGGWVAGRPNPADGTGVQKFLTDTGHRDARHQPAHVPGQSRVARGHGRRLPGARAPARAGRLQSSQADLRTDHPRQLPAPRPLRER